MTVEKKTASVLLIALGAARGEIVVDHNQTIEVETIALTDLLLEEVKKKF